MVLVQTYKFGCPRDARFESNVFVAEEEVHVLRTSVRGLEMPVVECPSYARGACPFLCPWSALCFCLLHMYNKFVLLYGTVVQYEKRADTNERTTNEIPFNRKDYSNSFLTRHDTVGRLVDCAPSCR